MKNLGVAIVDMQESYLNAISETDRIRILATHHKLLDFAAEHTLPLFIFYTAISTAIDYLPREKISTLNAHFFYKQGLNGFNDTFAGIAMQSLEISRLIMSGVYRSDCVCETAWGARERGIHVYSSLDLTADHPILTSPLLASNPPALLEKNAEVFSSFEDLVKKLSCHHSN